MKEKTTILFTIDSLSIGGAEKSLVTLLNHIDYDKYSVDLQLFAHGGAFEQFLPKDVNLLPPLSYSLFLKKSIFQQLLFPCKLFARISYSIRIRRKGLLHADKARIYWQTVGKCIEKSRKTYDVAIGYAQGIPTFYVVEKVQAKKKLAWVNAFFNLKGISKEFNKLFYEKIDIIIVVSDSAFNFFSNEIYPDLSFKMKVFCDLIDVKTISQMASLPTNKTINHTCPIVMTVGRLNKPQKGYDLALEAAKILRDRGVLFHWYAIGEGPYRAEMEQYIVENHLENHFVLLGSVANPYSYIRICDVYVQPSRFEGFGLTIAEAKILNRPVICTSFEACSIHIKDGFNGLISSFEPKDIADKIESLLNNKLLYNSIQSQLKREKIENVDNINLFYKMLESD